MNKNDALWFASGALLGWALGIVTLDLIHAFVG